MAIRLPLRSSLHARVGDKRLSGTHRSSCCGELREATDRFARGREDHLRGARPGLESSVCRWHWCSGHSSERGWQEDLLWIEKLNPLWPVCNYDSAVKHHCQSVCKRSHAPVCWNQGQPSPRFVWEWWVGRRSVRLLQAIIINYDKSYLVNFISSDK